MQYIFTLFGMALTAFALENPIFARALGFNKSVLLLKSRKQGIIYGVTMAWVLFWAAFPVSLCNYFLRDVSFIRAVRAPLYFLCVLLSCLSTYFAAKRFAPKILEQILPALPISAFNTALFGALYVSAIQGFTFFETVGYALGMGAGYALSLLIIYYARKRLAISPVPRSFRGLPILLVYVGLLSLAIYGLIGHGLPV